MLGTTRLKETPVTESMNTGFVDSVGPLWADARRRFRAPLLSVTFYLHLVLGVVVCGGIGIWHGIYVGNLELKAVSASLFTYFPAIVAAALVEFTQEKQLYLRSFGLLAAGVFLVVFFIAVGTSEKWQFFCSAVGAVLAVLFWWIAVGEKDCFRDIDRDASVGGDIHQPLLSSEDKDWKT